MEIKLETLVRCLRLMEDGIEIVDQVKANKIIRDRKPKGMFLLEDNDRFIAIDNKDGYAWTEEFKSEMIAKAYLVGIFGCDELEELRNNILYYNEKEKEGEFFFNDKLMEKLISDMDSSSKEPIDVLKESLPPYRLRILFSQFDNKEFSEDLLEETLKEDGVDINDLTEFEKKKLKKESLKRCEELFKIKDDSIYEYLLNVIDNYRLILKDNS